MLLPALILSAAFAGAGSFEPADFEAWTSSLTEEDLHTKTFSTYAGRPADIFALCGPGGKLELPKPYLSDYRFSKQDLAALQKTLDAARRYAKIEDAAKDGYLPSALGFIPSVGLEMVHPDLVRDGDYDFAHPDVLAYLRKTETEEYRLVGMIFISGPSRPLRRRVDFGEYSRLITRGGAPASTWGRDDDVCIVVEPARSATIYYGADAPHGCKDGARFDRMYRLYVWTPVYNPLGLFAGKNTVVDWLDHAQDFPPLCPKRPKPRSESEQ